MFKILSEKDMFGRFYLKKMPNEGIYKNYYATIDALRPILKSEEWQAAATGYYINAPVTRETVRLSYFTSQPDELTKILENFISKNSIEHAQEPELPHQTMISSTYGKEEIRFRKFLYLSTLIGLDLMEKDLMYSRYLFATFRYRFMQYGEPYRKHFLKAFEEKSQAYRSLSEAEKTQLWSGLEYWPNPPQVDWIHMMVNMVMGCDVNNFGKWKDFISSRNRLSKEDTERILESQFIKVPPDWRP